MRWRALTASLALLGGAATVGHADPLSPAPRLRFGVGDRLVYWGDDGARVLVDEAQRRGLPLDYVEAWLTRGWEDDWLDRGPWRALFRHGVTPVVVHYWFGDDISRERIEAERDAWHDSLSRMARSIRAERPVLVVLEPEFNVAAPRGETAARSWPGFAEELRTAARLVRREAPNARVGVCAGDFAGPPGLERALAPVADDLDFLAFQEMRAATDPEADRKGYTQIGDAALEYATYLKRAFGRPLLLAYAAVSSHPDWEQQQAEALEDLARHGDALRGAGVFGIVYMQLFDDPRHGGYFGPAEKHFGLLRADGTPKPAFSVLRSWAVRERARAQSPASRPSAP